MVPQRAVLPCFPWLIFHCVHVPHLLYPFICRWTLRLLPCPGYCKQCCNEHCGTCLSFFFNKFIYLFIYFWLHWVFVAARGLSLVVASRGYSSLQCVGFSLQWLLLLQSTGSRQVGFSNCGTWLSSCGSWALERRLSSCGSRAQLLRGTWDLPGPGLEPVSPALAGVFLTTVPPGKPMSLFE